MHKATFTCVLISIALAGALTAAGAQADGRIEINQASVEAAGGFPYTISEPGSYVLTGNLTVPAETTGLVIATSYVTIDLNGFSITGPASCTPSECQSGDGFGIVPQNFLAHATRSTVRNGIVRGFSGICVLLTTGAHVEDLMVSECGLIGISAGNGVVTGNRVINTGQAGLSMAANTTFAHNHVENAGLGGGDERAIEGGRASAGNSCDDFSCSPRGERRYYLTQTQHVGNEALGACATGFHMASLWEILDTSSLYYDVELGDTFSDSGSGPPLRAGWVRTGSIAFGDPNPGSGNCLGWSSEDAKFDGTWARPSNNWNASPEDIAPFDTGVFDCSETPRVWCVED